MEQQNQALSYFDSHARDWNNKALDKEYSLIDNRHRAVTAVMAKYSPHSKLLDVGCGTGQLAIDASKMGWKSLGLDYANQMIAICMENNLKASGTAKFLCESIFDSNLPKNEFDVISAQGFIEYISLEQLDQFLAASQRLLTKNGRIALGSRNRLFNLHSLNKYTELELTLGTINMLLHESIILQSSSSQDEAISSLRSLNYTYTHPTHHPLTGIEVDTRYQFTPLDLINKLAEHGLIAESIYPVNFHPVPLTMLGKQEVKEIYKSFAAFASTNWISESSLVPYSSSFVLEAKKL